MADREYMRRLVDAVLGPERNALPGSAPGRALRYDSPGVCRAALVLLCPHAELAHTKAGLGPCPHAHHDPALRAELEALVASGCRDAQRRRAQWEAEAAKELARHVRDLDGRIERTRARTAARLGVPPAPGEAPPAAVDVCDTCGAVLPADDARRAEAHFGGRQHGGWTRVRQAVADAERRLGREALWARARGDHYSGHYSRDRRSSADYSRAQSDSHGRGYGQGREGGRQYGRDYDSYGQRRYGGRSRSPEGRGPGDRHARERSTERWTPAPPPPRPLMRAPHESEEEEGEIVE